MIARVDGVKPKRRSPEVKPVIVVGGIDPNRTYAVHEFLAITRISRQKFSTMRRANGGLVVRDAAGVPIILGQDWHDYIARQPKHVAKQRRPSRKGEDEPSVS